MIGCDFSPIEAVRRQIAAGVYPSIARVAALAAERAFDVPRAEIAGRSRERHVAQARHAVVWTLRQATPWSLQTIGRRLGRRDHTTILSSLRRADQLRAQDRAYRLLTDAMVETVRAAMLGRPPQGADDQGADDAR